MGDDDIYDDGDAGGGGGAEVETGGKSSALKSLLPKILKWVAIILAAVIFIVTVVFFTMKILNRGTTGLTQANASDVLVAKTPAYDWYSIPEIRSRTADQPPATVIVEIRLGYESGSKAIQGELVRRENQLFDLVRQYFSRKTREELSPNNEAVVKQELQEQLNRLLTIGNAVQQIVFRQYNVYDF
ncbi:MAG: flagellar basal body-associated protein FliL [Spirochaetales bacterium]|jgi:flagellar FliL protein|nr:flagellar basal body-associated protein FliL [Spirochaetales bacterium]